MEWIEGVSILAAIILVVAVGTLNDCKSPPPPMVSCVNGDDFEAISFANQTYKHPREHATSI